MEDFVARIGLAFSHLLNQSSVNGPQREEVQRLADELQRFEGNFNDMVNARVAAAVEGIEGRLMAHVDGNFERLADVLEAAEISFQPTPAPLPVVTEPPADVPADDAPAPVSTTGNIPAEPDPNASLPPADPPEAADGTTTGNHPAPADPNAPEPVEGEPVEPAEGSTTGNPPHVEPEPVVEEAPVEEAPATVAPIPLAGSDTVTAPDESPGVVDPASLPNKAAVADAIVAAGGEAPPVESTSRADLEATLHEVQGTSPDGADSVAGGAGTASGPADTTIIVEGGGNDVVG